MSKIEMNSPFKCRSIRKTLTISQYGGGFGTGGTFGVKRRGIATTKAIVLTTIIATTTIKMIAGSIQLTRSSMTATVVIISIVLLQVL